MIVVVPEACSNAALVKAPAIVLPPAMMIVPPTLFSVTADSVCAPVTFTTPPVLLVKAPRLV